MSEAVEGSAALAWRLLATLEGGSLVLAAAALLAYTARPRRRARPGTTPVNTVLITNSDSDLGKQIKSRLESRGCTVSTVTSGAGAGGSKVDAVLIVGSEHRAAGLDGLADLVAEDVYSNLKVLDQVAPLVRRGGLIVWASAGAEHPGGNFVAAAAAFDAALRASLDHVAKSYGCKAVWLGRCERSEAADRVVAELMPRVAERDSRFSLRNAASKVSGYVGRWLKIAT